MTQDTGDRPTPLAPILAAVAAVLVVVAALAFLGLRDGDADAAPGTVQETAVDAPPPAEALPPEAEPPQAAPPEAPAAEVVQVGDCSYAPDAQGPAKPATPPTEADLRTGAVTAAVATSVGPLELALDGAGAPCAVASFVSLARQGFYDQTPCHRLASSPGLGTVLQCGDPTGQGTGGPGYVYAEEALEGATYPRGTVALAKTQAPATSGSQFFLVLTDSSLPPEYTPVGRITTGLAELDAVAAAGSTPEGDGSPNQPVELTSVTTTG